MKKKSLEMNHFLSSKVLTGSSVGLELYNEIIIYIFISTNTSRRQKFNDYRYLDVIHKYTIFYRLLLKSKSFEIYWRLFRRIFIYIAHF